MFGLFSPMWLLGLIPEVLIHVVLGLSIASLVVTAFVPLITRVQTLIIVLVFGAVMWLQGATWTGREYLDHLNKAKENIALLEAKQQELTDQLAEQFKAEQTQIRETGTILLESVRDVVTEENNAQCPLPPDIRLLHDSAASNEIPRPTRRSDGNTNTSEEATVAPKLSELMETTVGNYNTCAETKAQLEALQKWVREMQRTHDGG